MSAKGSGSSGIGFFGLLGIVFITLRLTGHIDWDWYLVLAPIWGPFALIGVLLLLGAVFAGIAALLDK